jgi:hypothetical protein
MIASAWARASGNFSLSYASIIFCSLAPPLDEALASGEVRVAFGYWFSAGLALPPLSLAARRWALRSEALWALTWVTAPNASTAPMAAASRVVLRRVGCLLMDSP